jgi:hypothetical protein
MSQLQSLTTLKNKLPKTWNQITIETFIELKTLSDEDGVFNYQIDVLCTLLDCYPEDIEELAIEELEELLLSVKFIRDEPPKNYKSELGEYKLKPFNKITLGEFISLEAYFSDNYLLKLLNIVAILYRRVRVNEWGDETLEPYNYHSSDRLDWFLDFNITDVFGLLPEYIKFREDIIDQYKNLMTESYEDDFEIDSNMDAEDLKAAEEEKKQQKWAWETLIWHLCNEDLTKFHAVCDLPLILVFNFLGMKKELNV